MKVLILSRARLREPSLKERFEYYRTLLRGRLSLEHQLVPRNRPLAGSLPARWEAIALDERGEQLDSRGFAKKLNHFITTAAPGIAFLLGDADGFRPDDLDGVRHKISLSKLTFPHQLCFVLLAEQVYRADTILKQGRYHRD